VTTYQWLLVFHIAGAFLFVSGAVVAGVLQVAAVRAEEPAQVALILRLARPAVMVVGLGALISLGFGIWLVAHLPGFDIGDGWIAAALALWFASLALGGAGGRQARHTRYLAEQLAEQGAPRSEELDRRLADPVARVLNYGSFAAAVAILVLMVWKPGA
jgi:uncharacterized membrane protein